MKSTNRRRHALTIWMAALPLLWGSLVAQAQAQAQQNSQAATADSPVYRNFSQAAGFPGQPAALAPRATSIYGDGQVAAFRKAASKSQEAYQKLLEAKDEAREEAEDELRGALEEEYDMGLVQYEKHLEQMESRLKKLREELDRRRDAKREMVDLKLQWMLNSADGIDWPGATHRNDRLLIRGVGETYFTLPPGPRIERRPSSPGVHLKSTR